MCVTDINDKVKNNLTHLGMEVDAGLSTPGEPEPLAALTDMCDKSKMIIEYILTPLDFF